MIRTLFGLHVRQKSPFHVGNKEVDFISKASIRPRFNHTDCIIPGRYKVSSDVSRLSRNCRGARISFVGDATHCRVPGTGCASLIHCVFDVETGWQLSLTAAWLNAVRSSPSEHKREKSDTRHTKRDNKRDLDKPTRILNSRKERCSALAMFLCRFLLDADVVPARFPLMTAAARQEAGLLWM